MNALLQSAGGLLVDERGKVLFGLRSAWKKAWPEHWDAIGGRLEKGETADQALVRELKEEIGVTVNGFTLLGTLEGKLPEVYGKMRHHIYAVSDWTGEPFIACDEHSQLCWFSVEELERLPNLAGTSYPELAQRAIDLTRLN